MFAVEEYNAYADAQERADKIWQLYGDSPESEAAQAYANELWDRYNQIANGVDEY